MRKEQLLFLYITCYFDLYSKFQKATLNVSRTGDSIRKEKKHFMIYNPCGCFMNK